VYHQPVHTWPARHAPVATVIAPGRHEAVQIELAVSPSPCVRQVEPVPPQELRSVTCDASFSQLVVHIGVVPVGMHTSVSPQAGSIPPIGSGIVHGRPALLAGPSTTTAASASARVSTRTSVRASVPTSSWTAASIVTSSPGVIASGVGVFTGGSLPQPIAADIRRVESHPNLRIVFMLLVVS
jgi:hypothetical protein